jgi:hypothetical protein
MDVSGLSFLDCSATKGLMISSRRCDLSTPLAERYELQRKCTNCQGTLEAKGYNRSDCPRMQTSIWDESGETGHSVNKCPHRLCFVILEPVAKHSALELASCVARLSLRSAHAYKPLVRNKTGTVHQFEGALCVNSSCRLYY